MLKLINAGYFIYYKSELVGQQTLFAMLWKEYALSDSRYLTGDLFTICIETITVVCTYPPPGPSPPSHHIQTTNRIQFAWGPLSLLAAASVIYRSPGRHFLQVAVCMAHLYGVLLYYATNWADFRAAGVSYSRPEALYYWVYYVGFNMPWLVVPLALLWQSWSAISRAVAFQRDAEMAAKKE